MRIKMKTYLILISFLFLSILAYGQNIKKITYVTQISDQKKIITKDSINSDFKKKTDKLIKELKGEIFELFFDKNQSLFRVQPKMELDVNSSRLTGQRKKNIRYKSLIDSVNIEQREFLGKLFNITSGLNNHSWIITNQSKKIAGYVCYKATSKKIEKSFINDSFNEIYYEAWFTPEIPVPFGPDGIDGLPGLVLASSINNLKFFHLVKLENLNETKVIDLINLKKGKNITELNFNNLIKDKIQSLRNNN